MKKIVVALSAVCLTAMLAASCSKSSSSSSVSASQLQGTWKVTTMGVDGNGNGQLDANEKFDPATLGVVQFYTFNSDYSGKDSSVSSGVGTSTNLTWSLSGSNITIVESGSSETATIESISSSSMTVKGYDSTSTPPVANWLIMTKQ